MRVALATGLHPDHPLQTTYGRQIADDHVRFANEVASSIRQWGGVTGPADPNAGLRPVGDGTPASDWFSVGGAPSVSTGDRHPELRTPMTGSEELAPDANTEETALALTNIVRTQNENLDRRDAARRAGVTALPDAEVGGWSSGGDAVHDVADVRTYGDDAGRRSTGYWTRNVSLHRGEESYFDARHGAEIKSEDYPHDFPEASAQ